MSEEDKKAITDTMRAVLLSDEFLAEFVAKWLDTPFPNQYTINYVDTSKCFDPINVVSEVSGE